MAFPMSREYEKGTFKHKMAESGKSSERSGTGTSGCACNWEAPEAMRGKLQRDFRIYRFACARADKVWADPLYRKHLQIEYYMNDEMKITGRITAMEYV